jgi:hypothetical protein
MQHTHTHNAHGERTSMVSRLLSHVISTSMMRSQIGLSKHYLMSDVDHNTHHTHHIPHQNLSSVPFAHFNSISRSSRLYCSAVGSVTDTFVHRPPPVCVVIKRACTN